MLGETTEEMIAMNDRQEKVLHGRTTHEDLAILRANPVRTACASPAPLIDPVSYADLPIRSPSRDPGISGLGGGAVGALSLMNLLYNRTTYWKGNTAQQEFKRTRIKPSNRGGLRVDGASSLTIRRCFFWWREMKGKMIPE